MRFYKFFSFLSILYVILFLIMPTFVFAGGLVPCGTSDNPRECTFCDLLRLVQNIIGFLRNLGIALAVLFIAWGGFLLLISGESEERRVKGKETLKAAVIGVIIILSSWIIINTVLTFAASGGDLEGVLKNWSIIRCVGD